MRRSRLARAAGAARLGALLAATALSSCAHQIGKNAAAGAMSATRELKADVPPDQQVVRVASGRVVEGAVEALDRPEQRERIRKLVDAAVADAVASALRAALAPTTRTGVEGGVEAAPGGGSAAALLAGQIGRAATDDALGRVAVQLSGESPLRASLVSTSASATDAAVGAALTELFPGCRGDGEEAASCRRAQMQALTRATAASFSAGVRDSLAWPLLLLVAILGLTLGGLAHWVVSLRRRRPQAFRPI